VAALNYDPAPWGAKIDRIRPLVHEWFPARVEIWACTDHRNNRTLMAANTLSALGPDAVAAIPLLKNLTYGSNAAGAWHALLVLPHLGTNGQNHVLAMMADENCPYRSQALAAAAYDEGIFKRNVNPAGFPALAGCMRSKDPKIALAAMRMLEHIGPLEPDIAIPALAGCAYEFRRIASMVGCV